MRQLFGKMLATCALVLCAATPALAQYVVPPGATMDVPAGGTLNLSCVALDMQGALNMNGGTLSVDTSATFGAGASVTGSNGTISIGGDLITNGPLNAGANTVVLRDGCDGGNTSQISGTLVVQNLVLQSTSGRSFVLPAGSNITVLGTLTLQGAPGQDVRLVAASGTAVVSLGPAATVVRDNAVVTASVQIGPTATTVAAIPTLSEVGLLLLSLLMVAAVAYRTRGSQPAASHRRNA